MLVRYGLSNAPNTTPILQSSCIYTPKTRGKILAHGMHLPWSIRSIHSCVCVHSSLLSMLIMRGEGRLKKPSTQTTP